MSDRGFDEVMIVNPFDPRSNPKNSTFMRFHDAPEMGYYAEPSEIGYYGYYAEPQEMGYYGEPQEVGYYGEPQEVGYYGEPQEVGYYGEPQEVGYYGEPQEVGYYGEPQEVGYYGEPQEVGYYADPPEIGGYAEPVEYYAGDMPMAGYGQMPEMVGYSSYEPLAEDYPGVSGYGGPDMSGYVRETRWGNDPGCPLPTNVAGYAETGPLEGYVRPPNVNPSCENFNPLPGSSSGIPDTFRPLW